MSKIVPAIVDEARQAMQVIVLETEVVCRSASSDVSESVASIERNIARLNTALMVHAERLNALDAIASCVGQDPFGAAEPRAIFLAVKRLSSEHESMRHLLAKAAEHGDAAETLLRQVEAE